MAKHKLARFAENETFGNLFQHTNYDRQGIPFPLKGQWGRDYFHNDNPIVVELGCGKGDYTLALARRNPDVNYIGVDRKGLGCGAAAKMRWRRVSQTWRFCVFPLTISAIILRRAK